MGNKPGGRIRTKAQGKFDAEELNLLNQTFRDLASRNPSYKKHMKHALRTVDKVTFLRVFKLPGMLGERLFAVFDKKKDGEIDFEEFICGLGQYVRGTDSEKLAFIFSLYDLTGCNRVTENELSTMLNSVVSARPLMFASHIRTRSQLPHPANITDDTVRELVAEVVNDMISDAFRKKHHSLPPIKDSLILPMFVEWIQRHPILIEVLDNAFQREALSKNIEHQSSNRNIKTDDPSEDRRRFVGTIMTPAAQARRFPRDIGSVDPPLSSLVDEIGELIDCQNCGLEARFAFCYKCGSPFSVGDLHCILCGEVFLDDKLQYCPSCGFDLSVSRDAKIEPPLHEPYWHASSSPQGIQIEGYLKKVGARFKKRVTRWYIIKDNFMYSFRNRFDVQPASVIFLEGCFVERAASHLHEKLKYGIEITISSDHDYAHTRCIYAKTEEERKIWMEAIKKASNVHDIGEYYDLGDELGVGRFSSVREGTHKLTGKKYAIKIIDKASLDNKEREALRAEIAVLKLVNHPNIIKLKNQFETRSCIYLVTSLVTGGDLFDRILERKRFSEPVARSLVSKLLSVVSYLHERGIVHRDLKPENIMVSSADRDDDIIICDFGLSKFTAPTEVMSLACGTLAYVAPEVISGDGYCKKVDIWSVGVITYLLLRGRLPFDSQSKEQILKQTRSCKLQFTDSIWKNISDSAKDFITHMLKANPEDRLSAEEACAHPWFNDSAPSLAVSRLSIHLTSPDSKAILQRGRIRSDEDMEDMEETASPMTTSITANSVGDSICDIQKLQIESQRSLLSQRSLHNVQESSRHSLQATDSIDSESDHEMDFRSSNYGS